MKENTVGENQTPESVKLYREWGTSEYFLEKSKTILQKFNLPKTLIIEGRKSSLVSKARSLHDSTDALGFHGNTPLQIHSVH